MKSKSKHLPCERCDGVTVTQLVTKRHWRDGVEYLIPDVEAEVCSTCGTRYYHGLVIRDINRRIDAQEHGSRPAA